MELGEFEISIVDREWLEIERRLPSRQRTVGADSSTSVATDVNNPPPIIGAHHTDFEADKGRTRFLGAGLPTGSVWKVKGESRCRSNLPYSLSASLAIWTDLFQHSVGSTAQSVMGSYKPENPPDPAYLFKLPNHVAASSNVLAFQKQFAGSGVSGGGKWGFDIVYQRKPVSGAGRRQNEASTSEQSLTAEIEQASSAYDARFAETFTLPAEYSSPEYTAFAQACTSNLVGGIGYFYGDSIIDRSFKHGYDDVDTQDDWDEDDKPVANGPEKTPERALFTATPSRPFFPRGFYWDEGFHLAIIGDWDNDLTLDILKSWVDAIDENGWVAREQIMGEESRSKVPPEFQTQYPSAANPPTLPMAVTAFITRLKRREEQSLLDEQLGLGSRVADASERGTAIHSRYLDQPKLAQDYLLSIYPALRRHYLWFRRTQRGGLREWGRKATSRIEAYRWRGRTEEHVLTSGLDDYPRARPPHAGELHVDLMSWMGFFARTMAEVAEYLGEEDDLAEYQRHERGIRANLEDLHWSERDQAYCDVTIANVEDEEGYGEERSVHVCHKGYISLFPLMLQHVDVASPHVGAVLDLISSPNELWSPYGIRSLSRSHPLYRQGEDYWRGPIWIQMNWMVLKALHEKYAREEGPYKERAKKVYDELRRNVVENVFKVSCAQALFTMFTSDVTDSWCACQEYQRTGYVWEQYDPDTGEGRRSHPFTGWTSLVTLIMTERY